MVYIERKHMAMLMLALLLLACGSVQEHKPSSAEALPEAKKRAAEPSLPDQIEKSFYARDWRSYVDAFVRAAHDPDVAAADLRDPLAALPMAVDLASRAGSSNRSTQAAKPLEPTVQDDVRRVLAALRDAVRRFPDSKFAPQAQAAAYEILRSQGRDDEARTMRDLLIESYPAAPAARELLAERWLDENVVPEGPFPVREFKDYRAESVHLDDSRFDYSVLYCWIVSCGPCIQEMKELREFRAFAEAEGTSVRLIGVCFDKDRATFEKALGRLAPPGFRVLMNDQKPSAQFPVMRFPTTFLLDSSGRVVLRRCTVKGIQEVIARRR